MPSRLVVKKGLNNCADTSSAIPGPTSATSNISHCWCALEAAGSTRNDNRRTCWAKGISAMACMALRARLSSTCSTMVRSHNTGGKWAGQSIRTCTASLRACRCTSGITFSSNSRGVTGSCAWSRRRTKSCTLLMTWPARSACRAIRVMASCRLCCNSSRSASLRLALNRLRLPVA